MQHLSSQELMAICDGFWIPGKVDHGQYVLAFNELANRGREIRDWCRSLLTHPDYYARESGAFLLGALAHRRQLGDAEAAVIAELGALTQRPIDKEGKELQAIDAAIKALAKIRNAAGIPFLNAVLFSQNEWLVGDTQWEAADALGQLVGEEFLESSEPLEAAKAWLLAHPSVGSIGREELNQREPTVESAGTGDTTMTTFDRPQSSWTYEVLGSLLRSALGGCAVLACYAYVLYRRHEPILSRKFSLIIGFVTFAALSVWAYKRICKKQMAWLNEAFTILVLSVVYIFALNELLRFL